MSYYIPGAVRYRVHEFHGGEVYVAYEGTASQITVNRINGAPINAYAVIVDLGVAGWTQSAWLYLHNETVSIPIATATLLPTPVPTATLEPSIFADGFETGNFSRWTSNVNDLGDLSVSTQAALVSAKGMQAVIDDNNSIYVRDDTPAALRLYRARFYFDPNSIPMTSGNAHYIFYGYNASSTVVLRVEFTKTTVYQLRAGLLNDTSTGWTTTGWFTITDAPHFIELYWRASKAPGLNNGGLTFWVDGVQKADLTGVDNDTRQIESVRLGAVAGVDTGTRGTYYFDAFESHLTTYIGPALREGLMAYWKLDEANNIRFDSVNDQTPANNLNDFNTVGQAIGKVGNASQFFATNSEYLSVPDNADLSTGNINFTITGWIKLDSINYGVAVADPFVSKRSWPTNEYQVDYYSYAQQFVFHVWNTDGSVKEASVNLSASVGVWYFFVAWRDATDSTVHLSIDNGPPISSASSDLTPLDSTSPFMIGYGSVGPYLNGVIDEVGFWKRVLNEAERTALYNCNTGITYPFNIPGICPP
ncbi:MAG: LamG domain-containing protein [Chloroflexi bacterium]|nr:LamG domain-containing protein [Chloroflexota bacterium]